MEKQLFTWKLHISIFLAHFAFAIINMERFNLTIALVAMVSSSNQTKVTKGVGTSFDSAGGFHWDQAHQGMLLSAFFYGYISSQLPAGVLVDKCGGKVVCGVGVFLSSLFTVLTPLAAIYSFPLVMVVRVCMGLSQGVTYPALLRLLRNWSTIQDKSRLIAIATAGTETGAILAFSLGGIICDSNFLGGWPAAFFVFGAMGIVWFIAWMALVAETLPQRGPTHDNEEILSLMHSSHEKSQQIKVPWLKIFFSTPLWAATIGFLCQDWIWFFIVTELPLYYKQVMGISVMKGGMFSTLPIIAAFLTNIVSGFISDDLQRRGWSVKANRRFTSMLGFFPTALLFVVVSYTKQGDDVQAIIYITLIAGVLRLSGVTFLSNFVELSPTFTGVLVGLSNTVANSAGIGVPLVTGYFTNHDPSPENYRIVFFINAAICVLGSLFFHVFVSSDVQEWDPVAQTKNERL